MYPHDILLIPTIQAFSCVRCAASACKAAGGAGTGGVGAAGGKKKHPVMTAAYAAERAGATTYADRACAIRGRATGLLRPRPYWPAGSWPWPVYDTVNINTPSSCT